ncbi:type II secretion system protein [Candidatus Parcubacteria bacterium]|nr:type II secretion system protein [Candidatus Parcubacteria bacterium]
MVNKKFEKAYTMVEMITVVAIIMILSAVFVSLNQPQKKFALQRNVYSLSAAARSIQEMSMSISTIKINGIDRVPEGGYGIELNADTADNKNKKYYLYFNDSPDMASLIYGSGEAVLNSPIALTDNVFISDISGIDESGIDVNEITQLNIIYYPPDPKILMFYGGNSDNALREATVTLKLGETKFIRKIRFNKLGLVSVDQKQEVEP